MMNTVDDPGEICVDVATYGGSAIDGSSTV